ncbi:MAG: FMN-binding negative transcriptional regulator [Sporolactobacillus sp.]
MYRPKHFAMTDENAMFSVVEKNSFATLISVQEGAPCATHLPLILDRKAGVLYGHFARANTQWKSIAAQEALAIFHGPHCYISPSWYETEQAVPTWNYVAVHVYGKVEIISDPTEIMTVMKLMTMNYEDEHRPYRVDEVSPAMISGLLRGIVAFKVSIDRMEGKCKLSQNHSQERRKRVVDHLKKSPHEAEHLIAELMEEDLN